MPRYPARMPAKHQAREDFGSIRAQLKALTRQIDLLFKQTVRGVEIAEKDLNAKADDAWDHREVNRLRKELDLLRKEVIGQLKRPGYYYRQIDWLQSRFPDARLVDVEGLVKLVDQSELEANDWSLTPGRYVGVAPPVEDEDFNFEETIRDIHLELEGLNQEAIELARIIQSNFEDLGI